MPLTALVRRRNLFRKFPRQLPRRLPTRLEWNRQVSSNKVGLLDLRETSVPRKSIHHRVTKRTSETFAWLGIATVEIHARSRESNYDSRSGLPSKEERALCRERNVKAVTEGSCYVGVSGFMGSGIQRRNDGRVNDGFPVPTTWTHAKPTGTIDVTVDSVGSLTYLHIQPRRALVSPVSAVSTGESRNREPARGPRPTTTTLRGFS